MDILQHLDPGHIVNMYNMYIYIKDKWPFSWYRVKIYTVIIVVKRYQISDGHSPNVRA